MADYRRNNHSGGNRNFGRPRYNREQGQMYQATCANCGKQCEVPFRPTGNKPVLCRECFQNNRGSDPRRSEQRVFDKPRFDRENTQNVPNYQVQFDELNAKLDKILGLLTQQQIENTPLESEMSEETINEIVQEVQEAEEKDSQKKDKKNENKKSILSEKEIIESSINQNHNFSISFCWGLCCLW